MPIKTIGPKVESQPLNDNFQDLETRKVNKSGDTMTGPLTLSGDPTEALHPVSKQLLDAKVQHLSRNFVNGHAPINRYPKASSSLFFGEGKGWPTTYVHVHTIHTWNDELYNRQVAYESASNVAGNRLWTRSALNKTEYVAWAASTAYALTDQRMNENGFYYECTTAGTSGTTEPVWPTTIGATVTDGTAVWTCKDKFWSDWVEILNSGGNIDVLGDIRAQGGGLYITSFSDNVNGAPWHGIGKATAVSGAASESVQLAGFYGLRLKTSQGQVELNQSGHMTVSGNVSTEKLTAKVGTVIGTNYETRAKHFNGNYGVWQTLFDITTTDGQGVVMVEVTTHYGTPTNAAEYYRIIVRANKIFEIIQQAGNNSNTSATFQFSGNSFQMMRETSQHATVNAMLRQSGLSLGILWNM
jgi:hypothetical protein